MKYGSKTRSILTKLLQISAISFISFDVNNRRKKLDAILFGLCCNEVEQENQANKEIKTIILDK